MTIADAAPRTLPARTLDEQWHVGDVVVIDGIRWKFRALNRKTGRVVLSSANNVTAEIWWNTSLDKLPRRAAR